MAGLAQKGGAVYSHIRIANSPEDIHAIRVAAGERRPRPRRRHRCGRRQEGAQRRQAGSTASSSTPPNSCPATSRAMPISRCRPNALKRAIATRRRTRSDHFVECDAARNRAARQVDRRQHVHGRLLPIRSARCRCRRTSIEKAIELNGEAVAMNHGGLPLRPPRGRRSARRSNALIKPAPRSGQRCAHGCRNRSPRRSTVASNS